MTVEPARHRFRVEEFHRMASAGLFRPDDRLELIDGEVIEMTPIGVRHAAAVNRLTHVFVEAAARRWIVSPQNAVRLGDFTEVQPDIVLLRHRDDFYANATRNPGPDAVLLVVEVGDSSARWDRRVKLPLYAAAGIPAFWLVDLANRRVHTATGPVPDERRYAHEAVHDPGDTVTFEDVTVSVDNLVGTSG